MSEGLFAGLPRFDEAASPRDLDTATAPSPEPVSQPVEPAPQDRALASLEGALTHIAQQLDQRIAAAEAAMGARLAALIEALFPKLAAEFLADEIVRTLPEIIPRTSAVIAVRAPPALAERVAALIAPKPELSARVEVRPDPVLVDRAVASVEWGPGGAVFDADSLIAAWRAHLS